MTEFLRLLLLLGIAGSAVAAAGSAAAWWLDEERRLKRLMRRCLGGDPDAAIVAKGRNAAAGLRLDGEGRAVVLWNGGAQAVLYPLSALIGAELIIDGTVAARVFRNEPSRRLDRIEAAARQVTLRLVFDNPRDPDFELDLWLPVDERRREAPEPAAAIQEARRWLARAEAVLGRANRTAVIDQTPLWDDEEHAH